MVSSSPEPTSSSGAREAPGVSYDDVPTTRLPPPSTEQQILGERRPSGWVLQKLNGNRGPGRGVIHAVDCDEAPTGAPKLTLDQALDAAEHPGTRLCSLCSAAAELDPMLRGFEHGFGGSENHSRGTQ
ncbi:hypothetical protein QF030_000144 [Streptomyces rishiriensis]|uniref:Uncharacterized protein n=1 Tax=Streptomyces rishiriensis TaxID=68264 RepID=A0ABU0NFU1_STRRH|nr:hypothetical protein [Streptomyces rishiriensis]